MVDQVAAAGLAGTDSATDCDGCGRDIEHGEACFLIHQDEILDGLPLVKIVCGLCQEGSGAPSPDQVDRQLP